MLSLRLSFISGVEIHTQPELLAQSSKSPLAHDQMNPLLSLSEDEVSAIRAPAAAAAAHSNPSATFSHTIEIGPGVRMTTSGYRLGDKRARYIDERGEGAAKLRSIAISSL